MKLLPTVILSSLILFTSFANSQDLFLSGARNQSMAGASVCLSDCWSVFGNQAGLANLSGAQIGGSFQDRFLISELSTRSGLLILPVQSSVFAISFSQFGKNPFSQEKFGLSYARQIFPKLNFGVQFNYYLLFLSEDNRNVGSAGIELGAQFLVSERLILGFHLLNPYQTGVETLSGSYDYPSRVNFGLSYHFSDEFCVSSEIENDWSSHLILCTGMEYTIFRKFFLRAGFSGKPYLFSAGMGFQFRKISFDLAGSYHEYLGSSPSISFQYQF